MEPAVKLRREIVQELQEDIKELQEDIKELQEDIKDLQESNKELQEKLEGMEKGLVRFIQKSQSEGKNKEEVKNALQDIFSQSETEAEEKVEQHWNA